ncbi:unnamed protein product [Merluccius merluccius]
MDRLEHPEVLRRPGVDVAPQQPVRYRGVGLQMRNGRCWGKSRPNPGGSSMRPWRLVAHSMDRAQSTAITHFTREWVHHGGRSAPRTAP